MIKNLLKLGIISALLSVLLATTLLLQSCLPDKADITQWQLVTDCDLHIESCRATNGDQSLEISIVPKPIPVARTLGVEVMMENLTAERMQIDISGINMYMGFNRVPLSETEPNLWQGSSMLAFCTLDEMEWQVTVILHHADNTQTQIPFSLITTNSRRP